MYQVYEIKMYYYYYIIVCRNVTDSSGEGGDAANPAEPKEKDAVGFLAAFLIPVSS